ncbi:hypothetical protein SDC9_202636 [bioreactor metagenome]|uniref:Uncharacterized protein n=1 Tax=bioreactor metagenome TaxID=1076179 RepID=A0A645IUZ1_9ZZZZ
MRLFADEFKDDLVLFADFITPVKHCQHQIGAGQPLFGEVNTDLFGLLITVPDPRGIGKIDTHAAKHRAAAHDIARGAGFIRHDRPFFPQQDIEQGGFAHVGTPDDHNLQTLIQDARRALIAGAEQTLSQLADPGQQVSRRFLL